ncbi:uncharacterized protein LOC142101579 [Mixophyes fleayi]|uniref:uncharacterized protein LOC142101579 n=1 Tax=Mixophyes fleayi TaxID=3061075 RepID=UPI003F4D98B0
MLPLQLIETTEHQSEAYGLTVLSVKKPQQKNHQQDDNTDLQSAPLSSNHKYRELKGKSNRRKKENAENKKKTIKRTDSRELNEQSEGLTSSVKPTRNCPSSPSSHKCILPQSPGRGSIQYSRHNSKLLSLCEHKLDPHSSKFTSVSNKTNGENQHFQMTLNTSSGHLKRPCTNFDTRDLKMYEVPSNTADTERRFSSIKKELVSYPQPELLLQCKKQKIDIPGNHCQSFPLVLGHPDITFGKKEPDSIYMHQTKRQHHTPTMLNWMQIGDGHSNMMAQTATALPAFGQKESSAHTASPWLIEGQMSYTRGTSVGPQNTLPILMNVADVIVIPYIKLKEVTNCTAGTRKTKEFLKSTQSRDCTFNNDVIVIDDD